jgi:glucosyl-3-phosphoglycerate synthase
VIGEHAHVLVPLIRAQAAAPLTDVGDALVAYTGGYGRVVAMVELPPRSAPNVAGIMAERRRSMLEWISATDSRRGGGRRMRAPIDLRVTADIRVGIREAAYEQACDILVVEWLGPTEHRRHQLARVVEDLAASPPADLVLVRPDPERPEAALDLRRVLVPLRGGANARLAMLVAMALAQAQRARLTVLHVYRASDSVRSRAAERDEVLRVLDGTPLAVPQLELQETVAVRAGPVIQEAARDFDAVVMGAFAERPKARSLVRSSLVDVVRTLPGTVIIVRSVRPGD